MLCNWLDDPTLYQWVKFEADKEEVAQGLDDVIATRPDGRLVLLQVKFTVEPSESSNSLSWEWLLQHRPKGKSLLQKWSAAAFSAGLGSIYDMALVTNRMPDREFSECIDDATNRIDLSRVSAGIRQRLVEQLGSPEAVAQFFGLFAFRHSHQGYTALQRTLLGRFVPRHTTSHGWAALFKEAIDWAVRTQFPWPDGRIRIELVRGVLDARRPEPVPQTFRVPEGYYPPDPDFTGDFIERVIDPSTDTTVLWGSPGQGKSTYLSYLCKEFDQQSIPYIRHHYFINLSDPSDRFSFMSVANSLMAQMESYHSEHVQGMVDTPERLGDWLEACGRGYAAAGKRFVVVVDGLDHVWRENDGNKEPLDSLFKFLLPVPENVALILGTQKVADDQLPSRFTANITDSHWVELPRMSLAATKGWLGVQLSAHRFELPESAKDGREEEALLALSEAFQRISAGHPLHLTYSFEAVAREKRVLTPDLVEELPHCPDGDIRKYYRALWQRLSYQARDALHLVTDAGFIWPLLGLESCLNIPVGTLGREIAHLFDVTEAGQVPFHGSLLAFVKDDSEHSARAKHLLPSVVEWLEHKAPSFLKWGWLWILKARAGHPDDILTFPDRQWAIDSLIRAYPAEQISAILGVAERLAFRSSDFPRAIRLRWLNHRVSSGPKYQIEDYPRVRQCAFRLTDDDYPLRLLSSQSRSSSINDLYSLATEYLALGRVAEAGEIQEEIRSKINDRLTARAFDSASLDKASRQFLELAAATARYKPRNLLSMVESFDKLGPGWFHFFLEQLSKHRDPALLREFIQHTMPELMRRDLELMLVRLAGICRAQLHEWSEFNLLVNHPIAQCWALLYAPALYRPVNVTLDISSLDVAFRHDLPKDDAESYLHTLFFDALAASLEVSGAAPVLNPPSFTNRLYLNEAVAFVSGFATAVGRLLANGNRVPFDLGYRLLAASPVPRGDDFTDYIPLRRALLSITTDVFFLSALRPGPPEVPGSEWTYVASSPHFLFSEWLHRYLAAGHTFLGTAVIEALVLDNQQSVSKSISQFSERAEQYLELCELSIQHGLASTSNELLRRIVDCILGYGWHKDSTLSLVLDALSAISTVDPRKTKDLLTRICPTVANIGEITDGDETNHTKYQMAELFVDLMPRSFVTYYSHLLKTSEWHEADSVFSRLLSSVPLDSAFMDFVGGALWDSRGLSPLTRRASSGDTYALSLIRKNAELFGWSEEDIGRDREYDTLDDRKDIELDVSQFAPDALPALLEELSKRGAYLAERAVLHRWFDYWREQRRGMEVLHTLESYLNEARMPWGVAELLDGAFELSYALEGKAKAYKWLVAAQVQLFGWDPYYSEQVALSRFEVFSQHYAQQWKDFIQETAKYPFKTSFDSLIIPSHRLVQFLTAIGEDSVAVAVTETMIAVVLEEVGDQPIRTPAWFTGD